MGVGNLDLDPLNGFKQFDNFVLYCAKFYVVFHLKALPLATHIRVVVECQRVQVRKCEIWKV